jgi:hypothetical protein
MPALKYAAALGSGLGILAGIHSWAGISGLEGECPADAPGLLSQAEDSEEGAGKSVWMKFGAAAFRERLSKTRV